MEVDQITNPAILDISVLCFASPVPYSFPPLRLICCAGNRDLQCIWTVSAGGQDADGSGRDSRGGTGVRVCCRCLATSGRVSRGQFPVYG